MADEEIKLFGRLRASHLWVQPAPIHLDTPQRLNEWESEDDKQAYKKWLARAERAVDWAFEKFTEGQHPLRR